MGLHGVKPNTPEMSTTGCLLVFKEEVPPALVAWLRFRLLRLGDSCQIIGHNTGHVVHWPSRFTPLMPHMSGLFGGLIASIDGIVSSYSLPFGIVIFNAPSIGLEGVVQ